MAGCACQPLQRTSSHKPLPSHQFGWPSLRRSTACSPNHHQTRSGEDSRGAEAHFPKHPCLNLSLTNRSLTNRDARFSRFPFPCLTWQRSSDAHQTKNSYMDVTTSSTTDTASLTRSTNECPNASPATVAPTISNHTYAMVSPHSGQVTRSAGYCPTGFQPPASGVILGHEYIPRTLCLFL